MGDINQSAPPAETVVPPKTEATPPVTANVTPVSKEPAVTEKSIPYPRFKEMVDKKNDLENRLKKLEEMAPAKPEVPDYVDAAVKKLMEKGMEEESAKELVSTQLELAKKAADERVAPVEDAATKREVEEWFTEFKKSHTDYADLEPKMFEAFKNLSETQQDLISADPKGVQLLYNHVKVQVLEEQLAKKYEQGVKDGYENKQLKSAASTEPSSGPQGLPSRKDISSMTLDDYKKIRDSLLKPENLKEIAKS